jgi:hydrogenase maturation protein HypF
MSERSTYLIHIVGLVQGVGMRPFIYKIAKAFNLTGFVKNKGSSVTITVSGEKYRIDKFIYELRQHSPLNARINDLTITPRVLTNYEDFRILSSSEDKTQHGFILPDLAVCNECLKDIRNSQDRRLEYAFTNCTNCGLRYSIISDLPYDRKNTSMHSFSMCPACSDEYKNPENRRFHAQPNCCPVCGPGYYNLKREHT